MYEKETGAVEAAVRNKSCGVCEWSFPFKGGDDYVQSSQRRTVTNAVHAVFEKV